MIGIVNSDDWFEPDTLERVATSYSGLKYEVVYGMLRTFRDGKEVSTGINRHEFLEIQTLWHPACFITKAAYEDLGSYKSEEYKSSADYELLLRFFLSKKVTFTPVYHVLSNFVLGGMSSSNLGVRETARLRYSLGLMSKKNIGLRW